MVKSLQTSKVVSTSNGKDIKPFWNEVCQVANSKLWLPTATDWYDSPLTSWNSSSSVTVEKSWFSQNLITPVQPTNFAKTYLPSLASLQHECTNLESTLTKRRQIRLYPTAQQRMMFRKWFGASRYVYNQTVAYLKTLQGKRPSWTKIAKLILDDLPEWAKDIPYQIKRIAVKDACDALTNGKRKFQKTGQQFELGFRSRKNPKQSCYIPKSAVKEKGIYYTLSGLMNWGEELPDNWRDCRLVCYQDRWFLSVPTQTTIEKGENQARIVALDPGVRTFITFFSPDMAGVLGYHDFGRLVRLTQHLDDLISRIDIEADKKRKRRMRKASWRMRWKIRDLRDELHYKVARFLVDNFDIILIPTFETSQMVQKKKRKIRSKTVRSMLTWAHYLFKERIRAMAFSSGKTVIEVNEAYTSKTCSWSGEIVNVGSSETIRGTDGIKMHRDVNGARNILLRALAELPSAKSFRCALMNNVNNC